MWHEALHNNFFIKKLYKKVPELINVNINKIETYDDGHRITLIFELPVHPDFPPKKWINMQYNKIIVEISFLAIKNLYINFEKLFCKSTIQMKSLPDDEVEVNISGDINANIIAEVGSIQQVKAE